MMDRREVDFLCAQGTRWKESKAYGLGAGCFIMVLRETEGY